MALARGERLSRVVRIREMLPQGLFREDVFDPGGLEELVVVKYIRIAIKAPVFIVVRWNETGERYEYLGMDIELC